MYMIIGGDGREYGPVTAQQVRDWMAAGRVNKETQARAEGTDAWLRVGDIPELNPPETAPAASSAVTLPGRAQELDVFGCYERSWELLKANFLPLVGTNILIVLIQLALGLLERFGVYFLGTIFSGVFSGGYFYFILIRIRGGSSSLGDAFSGFTRAFVNLVGIGCLVFLLIVVGLVCAVVPGIYLFVAYHFAVILGIDKRMGVWDAMETSRRVISRQWWRMFGLVLLGIPVCILGFLCLGVGIFVAIPLCVGAVAYAYEDLCNPPPVTVALEPSAPAP
jgi:hypothetical protein